MTRPRRGDLNEIARGRSASRVGLSHPNFDAIPRHGVMSGRLLKTSGGVETYVYGSERPHLRGGTALAEALAGAGDY